MIEREIERWKQEAYAARSRELAFFALGVSAGLRWAKEMMPMGQVNRWLRRADGGYMHWCPGCEEMHLIPDSWTMESLSSPTFNPSVKITGKQRVIKDGQWTGEWHRGPDGKALDGCCHYFLRAGVLEFCGDCTHELKGQKIPLPPIPPELRDPGFTE